jgi:hypothetical protein
VMVFPSSGPSVSFAVYVLIDVVPMKAIFLSLRPTARAALKANERRAIRCKSGRGVYGVP